MKKILIICLLLVSIAYGQDVEYPYNATFIGNLTTNKYFKVDSLKLTAAGSQVYITNEGYLALKLTPPIIDITTTNPVLYLIGTKNNITLKSVTSGYTDYVLSNGRIINTTDNIVVFNFGNSVDTSWGFIYEPIESSSSQFQKLSYTFKAEQSWSRSGNTGVISDEIDFDAVYPVLYGVSTTDYSTNTTGVFTDLTTLVTKEGDKTVNFVGTGYLYYCIPVTWNDTDLSLILDHNGFDNTTSFTKITGLSISSSGLQNDWTKEYVIYKYDIQVTNVNWNGWKFKQ